MKITSTLVALGVVLSLNPASGFQLRQQDKPKIKTPKEIHKKWGGLGEVLEILFEVACRSKHQKDTHGEAVHIMKKDELTQEEFMKKKAEIQAANVDKFKQGCGMAVAEGEQDCREKCAERWGDVMEKRNECDDLCVKNYKRFEDRCLSKAKDLQVVYEMEQKVMENQNRCLETHCKIFPTTYTMDDEKEQKAEVKKRCKDRCTEKQIEMRCKNTFALSGDQVQAKIASKCAEEGTMPDCIKKSTKEVGGKKDDCQKDGEGDCDKDATDCEGKGDGDQAKEMCKSRKTMCMEKVTAKCTKEHKKGLDDAKKKCEEEAGDEYVKCKEEKFKEAAEKAVKKCAGEKKETCPDDCKAKCEVEKMNKCVKKFTPEPENEPIGPFCANAWKFLKDGSEIDESTGNPIMLLSEALNASIKEHM